LGGLGIIDLQRFGDALRMRWLWLRRMEDSRPWHLLPDDCDPLVEAMFHASTHMELGDGRKALFWPSRETDGFKENQLRRLPLVFVRRWGSMQRR